jgi:hypothetical protein
VSPAPQTPRTYLSFSLSVPHQYKFVVLRDADKRVLRWEAFPGNRVALVGARDLTRLVASDRSSWVGPGTGRGGGGRPRKPTWQA